MFGVDRSGDGHGVNPWAQRGPATGAAGGGAGAGAEKMNAVVRPAVSPIRGDGGAGGEGGGGDDDELPKNIMQAAYVGAFDLLKNMVAGGVAADTPDPIQGSTPLHWASFGGHLDVVRWLVRKAGADTNRSNNDGCTPLLFACERGHTGVAQWLVREGGAQVNVKDKVTWQTPLHRVCLNSQRSVKCSSVTDNEDLILWLIEAGADLAAMDRFGNHVEELRSPTGLASVSRSKLCDMISSARQDSGTSEEASTVLKRRSSVRRRSTGDLFVQLSPKLEAKHRAPLSRRGTRKGSHGSGGGGGSTGNSNGGRNRNAASPLSSSHGLSHSGSYVSMQRSRQNQRRSPGGRVVSKASSEDMFLIPARHARGKGGSGGGVAAPAAAAGERMGGGPPAPAVVGVGVGGDINGFSRGQDGCIGYMGEMVAMFGGGKGTEEGLRLDTVQSAVPDTAEARRRFYGSGQQVVETIRDLTLEKSCGNISDQDFVAKKRQVLEMEQLRREALEESRRRSEGLIEDAGAGILTSVGQNTPPPSPTTKTSDCTGSDVENAFMQSVVPPVGKDKRDTYRASDIDRYTNVNADGPRVFGDVPDSVKETLAAKNAAREADARQQLAGAQSSATEGQNKNEEDTDDNGISEVWHPSPGVVHPQDLASHPENIRRNKSYGGCVCVIT